MISCRVGGRRGGRSKAAPPGVRQSSSCQGSPSPSVWLAAGQSTTTSNGGEQGNFVGPGGGADKAMAALPRPGMEDGATLN
jgi:hypothetical protein